MMKKLSILVVLVILFGSLWYWIDSNHDAEVKKSRAEEATKALRFVRSLPMPKIEFVNKLILEKRFDEFEKMSKKYESDFKKDPLFESQLYKLYDAIDSIPELEKPLKKWVKKKPSYMSYCALGTYYAHKGYETRLAEHVESASMKSSPKVKKLYSSANSYLRKSIKDNSSFTPAYCKLIYAENTCGNIDEILKIHNDAIELVPKSFYVRAVYLNSLVPKWGGTYDKMDSYLKTINYDQLNNARVWSLQGLVSREKGSTAYLDKKYSESIEYYNEALSYGDDMYVYQWRGNAYWKIKKLEKALADLRKYYEYNKENKRVQKQIEYLSAKFDS